MANIFEEKIPKQGTRSSIRFFQKLDRNATGFFSFTFLRLLFPFREKILFAIVGNDVETKSGKRRNAVTRARVVLIRPFTFGYAAIIAAITSFRNDFDDLTFFARCTFAANESHAKMIDFNVQIAISS